MAVNVHVTVVTVTLFLCSLLLNQASGQTSLSSQDQQELLNAHNHFRGIVDPTASNMERMVKMPKVETRMHGIYT